MTDQFTRTRLLIGDEGIERLKRTRVAVFGLGGVGSYVVEALARSGVGTLDIVDDDVIALSNLNRLLYATRENVGQPKTEVVKARIASICPETVVHAHRCFYLPETADRFDFTQLRCRCDRHGVRQNSAYDAGEGGERACHQLHGRGKQAGSDRIRGRGHC